MTGSPLASRHRAGPHRADFVAFVAPAPKCGRTSGVANTALVLARAGHRTLIVDWSAEFPSVRQHYFRYFRELPASAEMTELSRAADRVTAGLRGRSGVWRAARFDTPGAQVDVLEPAVNWGDQSAPGLRWSEDVVRLAADLHATIDERGYDYALIDVTSEPDPDVISVVAEAAEHIVVVCREDPHTARGAARLAETIRTARPNAPRLAALARGNPGAEPPGADVGGLGEMCERIVQVPFAPAYARRPVLAVVAEPPDNAVARAYVDLAGWLTGGAIDAPWPDAETRADYRAQLRMDDTSAAERFTVRHQWPDRRWADWVRAQLEDGGAEVRLAGMDEYVTGRTVTLVPAGASAEPADGHRADVTVLLPGANPSATPAVSFDGLAAEDARDRLLDAVRLSADPLAPPPIAVRPSYPLDPPPDVPPPANVPVTEGPFVGRDGDLARLRDRLLDGVGGCEPQVIGGPPGVGKTELALRYIRFFRPDYDVIWWIPARTPELARAGLAELADELGIAPQAEKAPAVVRHLMARPGTWLLVFDDADDIDALRDLLPNVGRGHVLVTTRAGQGARLDAIGAEPGAELLRRRMPGLPPERGETIARRLEGLPLALELAACSLYETAEAHRGEFLTTEDAATAVAEKFADRLTKRLSTRSPLSGEAVTGACLDITYQTLEEEPLGRLTLRLLELCSWLAPEGVDHTLLASEPFLRQIAEVDAADGAILRDDSMVLDEILRICVRYGLAATFWGERPRFRMHRMVRELIRARMPEQVAAQRQRQLLTALAASIPPDVGRRSRHRGDVLRALSPHLEVSGAAESDDPAVRQWIVNHVRLQVTSRDHGGMRAVVPLAERLARTWPADLITGRLLGELANVHRALGMFADAEATAKRALDILHRRGDAGRVPALTIERGVAGDQRWLGDFDASLATALSVYEQMRRRLGEDHDETIVARLNVAESAYLAGDYSRALEMIEYAWRRQSEHTGEGGRLALECARRNGDYLGALGRWAEARRVLMRAYGLADRQTPVLTRLGLLRSFAIALRNVWPVRIDEDLGRLRDARNGLRELLGDDHPAALSARLSLAIGVDMIGGHGAAVREARACLAGYERVFTEGHPFIQLCRLDLSAFLTDDGAAGEAYEIADQAWDALGGTVGDDHPWMLVAGLHRARAMAAYGREAEAAGIVEATAENALEYLGPGPCAEAAKMLSAPGALRRPLPERIKPALYLDIPNI